MPASLWHPSDRILLLAAHPDDETASAGGQLAALRNLTMVHITDGAPRNLHDAARLGFATALDYANARARELECALELAGIAPAQCHWLGIPDQEACFHLARIARSVSEFAVDVILTHPYEGGHPDHDSAAFAAHAACRLLQEPPRIVEFASYHNRDGQFATGEFLPNAAAEPFEIQLPDESRALKDRMLACFATQREVLGLFPRDFELFRAAPDYDFTRPPHPGELLYERYRLGSVRGERWRALAQAALSDLFG